MRTGGLSMDQAPPLSIPASFFLTIPLGILFAGYFMFTSIAVSFGSPWTAQTLALAHAGTLGVLAMGMVGALYQMTPVIAGVPVPMARLAHIVHGLLLVGLIGFLWRLVDGPDYAMIISIRSFSLALILFLIPMAWALARPATHNETVQGMRLALASLAIISLAGLVTARGFAGGPFPDEEMLWVQIHMTLALLGWVGGLLLAVSWQVIPMFYLTSTFSKSSRQWLLGLLFIGLVLTLASVFIDIGFLSRGQTAAVAALPAAVAAWLLHPVIVLRNIAGRKRKRSDASLLFWNTGLVFALLLIPTALAALFIYDPRWQVLFGWLAIWGWAGTILHGMLSRIVPFLVWFHRYSARVGLEPVPSMRSLLSQRRIQVGFFLHTASVLSGSATILIQADMLAKLTGLLLAATAVSLASTLVHVLKRRK